MCACIQHSGQFHVVMATPSSQAKVSAHGCNRVPRPWLVGMGYPENEVSDSVLERCILLHGARLEHQCLYDAKHPDHKGPI